MTHTDLRKQRLEMAKLINAGKSVAEVCLKYRCSIQRVRRACEEYGVDAPIAWHGAPMKSNTYSIIAALIAGKRQVAVAREHQVTAKRVHQIANLCREHGIIGGKHD